MLIFLLTGYQWYWAGTQEHTKVLTPDLTQTVNRHVVVKRKVPLDGFPFRTANEHPSPGAERYTERLREALLRQFTFHFSARVRLHAVVLGCLSCETFGPEADPENRGRSV
jgi:hypothetical protein